MKTARSAVSRASAVTDAQALALHWTIAGLMREFRIEPGLLAGSVYHGLHSNDIGLFEILEAPTTPWTVRKLASALAAPISTISSALDRLERQGLVERVRSREDRRMVYLVLTARGQKLAARLRAAHMENCRAMLARIPEEQRDSFLELVARLGTMRAE